MEIMDLNRNCYNFDELKKSLVDEINDALSKGKKLSTIGYETESDWKEIAQEIADLKDVESGLQYLYDYYLQRGWYQGDEPEKLFIVCKNQEDKVKKIITETADKINSFTPEWEIDSCEVCNMHLSSIDAEPENVVLNFTQWSRDLEEVSNNFYLDISYEQALKLLDGNEKTFLSKTSAYRAQRHAMDNVNYTALDWLYKNIANKKDNRFSIEKAKSCQKAGETQPICEKNDVFSPEK